jgi:hypothetical protein
LNRQEWPSIPTGTVQVLPLERAVYLSFDDDRLSGLELDQLGFLLEEYYRRHPALRGRETVHWFLDQIQLVAGWECFVRRALDSEKVEIAVLGSSARMLSREVHTSLRGRGRATVIRPFPGATSGQAQPGEPAGPAAAILAAHRKIDEGDKRASMTPCRYDRIDGTRCTSSSTAPVGNRARKPRGSCQIE